MGRATRASGMASVQQQRKEGAIDDEVQEGRGKGCIKAGWWEEGRMIECHPARTRRKDGYRLRPSG